MFCPTQEQYRDHMRSVLNGTAVLEKHPTWSIKIKQEKDWYGGFFEGKDNCNQFSFDKWKKLFKIKGIRRVRGLMNSTACYNPEKRLQFHYWVETDVLVFDESGFRTTVAPKKEFHEFYHISDVEESDNGVFLNNNYVLQCGPDSEEMIQDCMRLYSTKNTRMIIEKYKI